VKFNADGTANIGSKVYNYSVGPSNNAAFPLAFILQTPNPTAGEAFAQVYSGMCSAAGGGGTYTNGLPSAAPGPLGLFSMAPA
jgi:hypothetical protein